MVREKYEEKNDNDPKVLKMRLRGGEKESLVSSPSVSHSNKMVRLTTALAVLAGASAVLASTPTQPSFLKTRAAGVTGCTCCGYTVSVGDANFQNMISYVSDP